MTGGEVFYEVRGTGRIFEPPLDRINPGMKIERHGRMYRITKLEILEMNQWQWKITIRARPE